MNLIVLSDSLGSYMECKGSYVKMEGFSKLDISKRPEVYIRRYAKEPAKNVNVTGCHTKISYIFDRMKNNAVHDFLARLTDCGSGSGEKVRIVLVDFSKEKDQGFEAVMQEFAVLCCDLRPENGFLDYTGHFIATGKETSGVALSDDGFKTINFKQDRRGILCD